MNRRHIELYWSKYLWIRLYQIQPAFNIYSFLRFSVTLEFLIYFDVFLHFFEPEKTRMEICRRSVKVWTCEFRSETMSCIFGLTSSVSIPKRPPLKLKSVHRIVWCSARRHKFTIFDRDWSMHFHKLWVSSLIVCFWCKIQVFLPTKENVLGLPGSIEPRIGWHLENITKCYNILQNITNQHKKKTKYYISIRTYYNILQQNRTEYNILLTYYKFLQHIAKYYREYYKTCYIIVQNITEHRKMLQHITKHITKYYNLSQNIAKNTNKHRILE